MATYKSPQDVFDLVCGDTIVPLLPSDAGYRLVNYTRSIQTLKGGGVFTDNPGTNLGQLVYGFYGNVTDTAEFQLVGGYRDDFAIRFVNTMVLAYSYIINYWQGYSSGVPPYVRMRVRGQLKTLYSPVFSLLAPKLNALLSQPFLTGGTGNQAVIPAFNVGITRGFWADTIPASPRDLPIGEHAGYEIDGVADVPLGNVDAMGVADPIAGEGNVFVSNCIPLNNITDIYIYNGASFGSNLMAAGVPFDVFQFPPPAGAYTYFGSPIQFHSMVFQHTGAYVGDVTLGYDLEYWDGATWSKVLALRKTLSLDSATADSWQRPSDWAKTTVNGVNQFWVRWDWNAVGFFNQTWTQIDRKIYAVGWPSIDIGFADAVGETRSTIKFNFQAVGGRDLINLYDTLEDPRPMRVLAGLRSTDRQDYFSAYQPFAQPGGWLIDDPWSGSLGSKASYADLSFAGQGGVLEFNLSPGFTPGAYTVATYTTRAKYYSGRFIWFIRAAAKTALVAGDWEFQIKAYLGSKVVADTGTFFLSALSDKMEVLEFGGFNTITARDHIIGDPIVPLEFILTANVTNGGTIVDSAYFQDFIILPVDEASFDTLYTEDDSYPIAEQGASDLIIDFVRNGKADPAIFATQDRGNGIWTLLNKSRFGYQHNADQKVWFFTMEQAADGKFYSFPQATLSVAMKREAHWLGVSE